MEYPRRYLSKKSASRFPKPRSQPPTDRSLLQSYHLSQHCEFLLHIAENGHFLPFCIRNVLPIGWKRTHHGFGCLYWCVAIYLTSQSGQPYLFFPLETSLARPQLPGIHYAGLSAPRGLFPKAQEGVSRRASPLGDGFRVCLGKRNCQERISCAAQRRTDQWNYLRKPYPGKQGPHILKTEFGKRPQREPGKAALVTQLRHLCKAKSCLKQARVGVGLRAHRQPCPDLERMNE
jgi:hypothetical protein